MTTANDIVRSAWRRITVSASDEPVPAADAADLLEILNDYLFSLKSRGASYVHARLDLADDLLTPEDLDGSLKAILAFEGMEHFGKPIPPGLALAATGARNFVLGVLMVPNDLIVEDGVRDPLLASRYNVDLG